MNNRGFGLSELLAFIGLFLFILVAVAIYGRVKLGNDSFYTQPDVDVKDISTDEVSIEKEYIILENKLKDASKKYSINKNNDAVITLKELQNANLINELEDPNDKNVLCNGYVVYISSNNQYLPFINCNGRYMTESYNFEYEY